MTLKTDKNCTVHGHSGPRQRNFGNSIVTSLQMLNFIPNCTCDNQTTRYNTVQKMKSLAFIVFPALSRNGVCTQKKMPKFATILLYYLCISWISLSFMILPKDLNETLLLVTLLPFIYKKYRFLGVLRQNHALKCNNRPFFNLNQGLKIA